MEGSGIRVQSNRPVLCINFNVSSRICLFTESGKSLSPYNNSCNKNHLQDLHIQVVVVMQRFQRGGLFYVYQNKGRATRSVEAI